MIYPGINIEKTQKNTCEKLSLLRELFRMGALKVKREIPVYQFDKINLIDEIIWVLPTNYDDLIKELINGINCLPFEYKYVLFNYYICDISLNKMKSGVEGAPIITNVYQHYSDAIMLMGYAVKNLIIYNEREG